MSLIFVGCAKTSPGQEQMWNNDAWKNIKSDCMMWCQIMRKSNEGNKERTVADMDKDCNSLCDASQWMEKTTILALVKNQNECSKIPVSQRYNKQTNDPAICKNITEKTLLYACYTAIAEKSQDASPLWKYSWHHAKMNLCG